jgi:hypothetical protein
MTLNLSFASVPPSRPESAECFLKVDPQNPSSYSISWHLGFGLFPRCFPSAR